MNRKSGRPRWGPTAWLVILLALSTAMAGSHPRAAPAGRPSAPLFVGFHDGWDPNALHGLAQHLAGMDVFAPRWITVRGPTAKVVVEPDDGVPELIGGLARRPLVFPTISNAHDEIWDQPAAEAVILNGPAQAAFAARLVELARADDYAGYVLDFENLSPRAAAGYPALLAALKTALAPAGKEVWVTATVAEDQPLAAFASSADAVVLMAYDECWANATPGPIAGEDWVAAVLASRLQGLDPRRVVVALASYGYDWPAHAAAKPVSVDQARALAARHGAKIRRDPASGDPWFAYAPASGPRHQVWFVDAQAFDAEARTAAAYGVRGVALWRLGLEDPGIWGLPRAFAPAAARAAPSALPHPCDPFHLR